MTPKTFSHSSLACYRRCRYQYYLKYVKDYVSPAGKGQIKGTAGHAALAEWYTNGYDDTKAIKKASGIITNTELETGWSMEAEWDELQMMLMRYFAWARVNDNFETIAVEQEYEIEVNGLKLMGFIDGIVRKGEYNYLLEHKFVKQASTQHIALDMQVSIYMLAAHKLGYNPMGTMYNIIRMGEGKKSTEEPVLRTIAYRNVEGLQLIEIEVGRMMEEVQKFLTEGGSVYRNPTKDCHWDCSFYDVCLSLNDSGEAESVLNRFSKRADKILAEEGVTDE